MREITVKPNMNSQEAISKGKRGECDIVIGIGTGVRKR